MCVAALFAVNAWILARFFKTEYTPFMGSIEGAYVAISRWMLLHGMNARWFPLWYGGIPARNTYPPLLHWLVALCARGTGMSVVHSHHAVSAAFYCLGPVALFLFALRLTNSHWKAFIAGVLYSVVTPSAFMMPAVRADMASVWSSDKIQALIFYGEGPHVTAITLALFALAAIDAALEQESGWRAVLAVVLAAMTALTNWLGAMSLVCGALVMLLTRRRNRPGQFILIGMLAYGLVMPWIPPSGIETVRRNSQIVGGYPLGAAQYWYLAGWVGTTIIIGLLLRRTALPDGTRFALLFLFLMAVPPLGFEWFHAYPLPQAERYHLELDVAIVIVAGIAAGSRRFVRKSPWRRLAAALLLCGLALVQIPRWRGQVRALLPPFDISKTLEFDQARWVDSHFPDERVFATGSTRFWLDAFGNNPQLGGGFDQGRTNSAIGDMSFAIPYIAGNGPDTVALLAAYGVRAISVTGKNTRNAYKDYRDPGKFAGIIPEVWREGDDVVYSVPGDRSLAHVVNAADLVRTTPFDWAAVNRFAAALGRSSGTTFRWDGTDHASIRTRVTGQEALSVQISWDSGWNASADGSNIAIDHDALGLMVLRPKCQGGCTISLVYTGGTEARTADAALLASCLVCGFLIFRKRKSGVSLTKEQHPPGVAAASAGGGHS